jgi:hypothetical protein
VSRHALEDIDGWRDDLGHVTHLREIVHRRGVGAATLRNLLDYDVRLALIASLFPDQRPTLHQAVARGAGAAHAAVLVQRRWRAGEAGTVVLAEAGQPPVRLDVGDAGMASPDWLAGLSLALVARDHAATTTLAARGSIDACAQPAETIDSFWHPYCSALAAAVVEPDEAVRWIELAIAGLEQVQITDATRAELVHYPLLPVMAGLAERNEAAFNAALIDALQRLRTYYEQTDQSRDWNGLFSLPLNGLCAAASDAGLAVDVMSDYLVKELVSGEFPRALTKVTLRYPPRAIADADEARWFLDLEGIPRQSRQHRVVEHDHQVVAHYEITDAPGLAHGVAEFILPPEGATLPPALDAGELLYLAEAFSSAGGNEQQRRSNLLDAVGCVELALRRIPASGDPIEFNSRRGREYYEAEPGRFDRERLIAYRDNLKRDLLRLDAASDDTDSAQFGQPRLREAEARVGALAALEVIRAEVLPLLEALAHDADGSIVAQIKPRDEDYARVFVGEAATAAREAYTALWAQETPRTAQSSSSVGVRSFLAPAGLLADENELSRHFPLGYRAIAHLLQPHRIWVAWKFLEPGAQSGEAFNGLVWVDDHWAWFPKPFRVLRTLSPQ